MATPARNWFKLITEDVLTFARTGYRVNRNVRPTSGSRRADYRRGMVQREFPVAPLVGAGGIVVRDNRVLLVRRGREPLKGQWSIPGGLIDVGETLREAVIREVKEETGLDVEPVELIELLDRIHREEGRVRYHYVIADYLCRVTGGILAAASDADAVRWVERAEWNSLGSVDQDLSPGTPERVLRLDPITTRVIEAAWQRARAIQGKTGESL